MVPHKWHPLQNIERSKKQLRCWKEIGAKAMLTLRTKIANKDWPGDGRQLYIPPVLPHQRMLPCGASTVAVR
jgi:hypothetical protein